MKNVLSVPIIPENAPFDADQRAWLNGFLAGLLGRGEYRDDAQPGPASSPPANRLPLLVLFGSQSGNAESLAKSLARSAAQRGFNSRALGLDAIDPVDLAREKNVLVVTSTWGEGEMPDNATAFWEGLNRNGSSPRLDGLRYSVLALGDRNYSETFCFAGRRIDERLADLGAQRIQDRVDCDVDYDEPAALWSERVFSVLGGLVEGSAAPASVEAAGVAAPNRPLQPEVEQAPLDGPAPVTRQNPFASRLLVNRRLNGEGSCKDTRHLEFAIDSHLTYQAGDALGVLAENCPEVVSRVIESGGLAAGAPVPLPDGREAPLQEALARHFEVRHLLGTVADQRDPVAFVKSLRRLQPRLYSIASSPKSHPGEIHLCVAVVRYDHQGVSHKGVASTFLADRLPIGSTARIFVQKSAHFRVPHDPSASMIMVGPGTGIAPFRAFVEERTAIGATGRHWLFFGDQHAQTDFLYRDEIERFRRSGRLDRLDLAFSRDQPRKLYVQHRMLTAAVELWRWIDSGAHFYVCGDASRMAKDVDAALHQVVQVAGHQTADQAAAYVAQMKASRRYLRDVY